jgi:hypothetical protein
MSTSRLFGSAGGGTGAVGFGGTTSGASGMSSLGSGLIG